MNALPTTFPRRVTTGPVKHTTRRSLRVGETYNYGLSSGQASYVLYAARAKVAQAKASRA